MRSWLTLGVPMPRRDASEIERLVFVRDLSVRSLLLFGPIIVVLFVVFAVPLWAFGVLAAAYVFQALSIARLTRRIQGHDSTQ
jgi:uncharacterized membrane protein